MNKICGRCKKKKDLENFRKLKSGNFESYCFDCKKEYKRKYIEKIKKDPNRVKKLKEQEKKYRLKRVKKQSDYFKGWYKKNKHKRNYHERNLIVNEWIKKNPEKAEAQYLINYAISKGKIKRKEKCAVCNFVCKTHAHHEDYLKPYDVIFLCASCHKKVHLGILTLSIKKNNKH